jgi:putative membrane protein
MALIFGIYERLIDVAGSAVRSGLLLLKFDFSGAAAEFRRLPWFFVLPLAAGIIIAPLAGARYIPGLLESHPTESRAVFFGLILGSIAIPWLRIRRPSVIHWFLLGAGGAAAFFLSGLPPAQSTDPSLLFFFMAGAIAMSAMILPGISGAYLLLVMGLYSPILQAIDQRDMTTVFVFMAGAGIGVGAFSFFIGWLLRRAHDQTMAVLVGLMIGSLRALWPWMGPDRELLWMNDAAPVSKVIGLMAAGLVVSGGILLWEIMQKKAP